MKFNVIEFDELTSKIDNWNKKIAADEERLVKYGRELSESVRSEDSDVADMVMNVNMTITKYREKLAEVINEINLRLKRYQTETLMNERQASKSLENINQRISSLKNAMDALNQNGVK